MENQISIVSFHKKYLKIISLKKLQDDCNSGRISVLIKTSPHKKFIIDEKEALKFYNIPKNLNDYIKLLDASKKYNISSKSLMDYVKSNDIHMIRILERKVYLLESDIIKILPKINEHKQKMSFDGNRNQELTEKLREKLGNDYILLDEYTGQRNLVRILHKCCGYKFLGYPSNILYKEKPDGCPSCFGTKRYSKEEISNIILKEGYGEYSLADKEFEYKSNKIYNIPIVHNNKKCKGLNTVYYIRLNDFINGYGRCPFCQMSSGEERIFSILKRKNINFDFQNFNKLDEMKYCFWDFSIPEKNILIEFDGEQHFSNIDIFDNIEIISKRDLNKNIYVSKHPEIKLFRISYNRFKDLDTILDKILNDKIMEFRDYPLGEYEQVLGNSVVLADNIFYIG